MAFTKARAFRSSCRPCTRAPARAQLETFKAFLAEQSTTLLSEGASSPLSDKAVFAKLLTRVIAFPDESFVYLVNGTPVLTFWGFVHPNADRFLDPLYCLYPRTEVPVAAPLAPVAEPVVTPPRTPVVVKRPWWRWLWWPSSSRRVVGCSWLRSPAATALTILRVSRKGV